MSKLVLAALVVFAALPVLGACVGLGRSKKEAARPEMSPIVSQRFGSISIHAVVTGWVRVKSAHRDLSGPVLTRMLSILVDPRWTDWMPVIVYVIEHPEGVFVVDAGLTERMLDEEHFACDAGNAFVYRNLLQFRFAPEDRIDRRLAELGIDLSRIAGVVLTHRHADHTDGLDLLPPGAPIYVGEGDWPSHDGALNCRWPAGRSPTLVGRGGEAIEAMTGSHPLTKDGVLRIVPLNGHSPGHVGVLVQMNGMSALFAGDAAFDADQVRTRRLAGIVQEPSHARETLDVIARQLARVPTFLLLAHEPESVARLQRRETTPP